jgi:hypothetical protein
VAKNPACISCGAGHASKNASTEKAKDVHERKKK